MIEKNIRGVPLLCFENLLPFKNLVHGISTRHGGVSCAPFASLNLGADTGDAIERVVRNYKILSTALGFDLAALVSSRQVHGLVLMLLAAAIIHASLSPSVLADDKRESLSHSHVVFAKENH